jgi:hypothetical protein
MTTIPNQSAVTVTPPDGQPYDAKVIQPPTGKIRLYTILADGRARLVPESQIKEIKDDVC